jgi:NAD(P)-dependent dehydrogenase (short-subunit alcohol dehydrogenase family)
MNTNNTHNTEFLQRPILVTGASGGVAQTLIDLAKSAGKPVIAVSRQAIEASDGVQTIQADVSQPGVAQQVIDGLSNKPDVLAHMAGNTLIAPMSKTSLDQYRGVMSANIDSAFFTLQAFVAACKADSIPGSAVFASSVVAQIGTPNHEAISAAKGAVESLVRAAAATHAAQGMRINAVAPGLTETPMTQGITRSAAMREAASKQYPLLGINTAQDVAQLVWWLCTPAASRITGQIWAVDGGFTSIRPLVR